MQRAFDLHIQWTAFPLHPETPEAGLSLEELFAGRGLDIPAMRARLKATADNLGLPLGPRTKTYNSRRAQELGKWAERQGQGDAYHREVFHAYFALGCNIALTPVLLDVAEKAGLHREAAQRALGHEGFKQAVDADWQRSRLLGISAVPTFLIEGRALVGAQPYAALEALVKESGATGRPESFPPTNG